MECGILEERNYLMQILLQNKLKYIFILITTYFLSLSLVAEEFVIENNDLVISGGKVEDVDKILSLLEDNENINRVVFNLMRDLYKFSFDIIFMNNFSIIYGLFYRR